MSDAAPPPPPLFRLLLLVLGVGTVNGLSRVTLPLLAASSGAQPWQIGLVGALGYAGMLTLSLPMGPLIERHGARRLFIFGATTAACLFSLMAWLHTPWAIIAVAALMGLALPFRNVPVQTEFLAMLPRLGPAKAGWQRATSMSGMYLVGPTIAGAGIAAAGFAPVLYTASGVLILGIVAGAGVLGRRPARQQGASGLDLGARLRGQLSFLRNDSSLRRTLSIDFVTQIAAAYFVVFGVAMAVRQFGMSRQAAVALVTVQGCTYVLMLLTGGGYISRLGRSTCYRIALGLLCIQALCFAVATGPAGLWVASVLMGLGMGIQGLLSTTRFAELMAQHGRGRVAGLSSMGPPAGGILGGVGGGLFSQQFGLQAGFLLLAVIFGLALFTTWRETEGW